MKNTDNNQENLEITSLKNAYKDLLIRTIVLLVVFYVTFGHVFIVNQVKGMDMFPAVKDGDLYIGFRLHSKYQKNDVIVYENNGVKRIGRIVASQNDVVTIEENGILRVNGTPQSGEIIYPTYQTDNLEYPYKVPEGHFFILGDFRTQSLDSRDLGAILKNNVKAKIITILRRQGI